MRREDSRLPCLLERAVDTKPSGNATRQAFAARDILLAHSVENRAAAGSTCDESEHEKSLTYDLNFFNP
jgi:hypothetical protein